MSRCRLVAFLLLCSKLLVARAANQVCYPDRAEGHVFNVETGTTSLFAIDFSQERFLSAEKPYGRSFRLIDFGAGDLHRFTDDNCSTVPFPAVDLFHQCIQDDFNLPNLPLGELLHPLEVTVIGFRANNVARVTFNTRIDDGRHIPFFTQDIGDDGTVGTVFYSHVSTTLELASSNINSDVSDCVHENWSIS